MKRIFSILFDSYHLYHLPQFEPLINLLSKDDRFEIFHSTSRTLGIEEFKLCSQVLKKLPGTYIQAETEDERASLIKSLKLNIFICGWSRYDLNKFVNKTTIVGMIYHGIGIKPSYWLDNHERLDFRLVEGEYRIDQLKKNNVNTDLHLTGFMKMDPLFKENQINIEKITEKFELNPKKKTILFAPTFYPSSIESLGMKIGEYSDGYNLLIKPHLFTFYLDKFADVNLRPQMKILRKLSKNFQHVHLISPEFYNIIPFYKIADVLLTDASSTIYEMLSLGKPVMVNRFFKLKLSHQLFRKRLYKKRLDANMENDIGKFCYQVTTPYDLPEVLDKVFKKHVKNSFLEDGFCEKMIYKTDGEASLRAKNIILSKLS